MSNSANPPINQFTLFFLSIARDINKMLFMSLVLHDG